MGARELKVQIVVSMQLQIQIQKNLWGIVKRKMRDTRSNNADELKAAIKATWASLHLSSVTN